MFQRKSIAFFQTQYLGLSVMITPNQELSSAGSSSSESTPIHYDVFLNFTSESTFTTALCDALGNKGIRNIFIDPKKLRKRKRKRKQVFASPDPLRAIGKSKVSILVFSEDYVSSPECLDELVKIMRCRRKKKRVVFPIFYKIEPTVVRHQKSVYEEAMVAHQQSFGDERVQKWKSALKEAAGLSGWHFEQGSEYDFVEKIVEAAFSKLPPKRLHTGEHIVGLDTCMEDVTSVLDTVSVLGIHGTAGVGKTTLAKAVYNSIVHQFEEACFLFNIREASKQRKGILRLQKTLLSEILDEKKKIKLRSVDEGISKIKQRLHHKRVLLVLDDVDEIEQLEQLAGYCGWCGNGSKIIVTTRNKQLLIDGHIDNEYGMKELNDNDSLKLFSRYAFHLDKPPAEYEEMSKRVVSYAQGLPLALKVTGSKLNHKSMEAWKCALDQLERLPGRKVEDVLKIMGK
ncbi:disease resistance protein RUN1-like [Prosopis cineraria]|uniref:disease resistance protein RUN1-like n=1 Tax=Prosopis cineraria TaxID=364024 RepID=UPI00240EF2DC|nr:disease resistance protein RUN1-like [Prosopis cineraria]